MTWLRLRSSRCAWSSARCRRSSGILIPTVGLTDTWAPFRRRVVSFTCRAARVVRCQWLRLAAHCSATFGVHLLAPTAKCVERVAGVFAGAAASQALSVFVCAGILDHLGDVVDLASELVGVSHARQPVWSSSGS